MYVKKLKKLEKSLAKAVEDARFWPVVCDDVSSVFGAVGTVINSLNPAQRGAWLVHSPSMQELVGLYFKDDWAARDHRQALAEIILKKGVVTDHDYITLEEKSEVPYYTDLLYPYGLGASIAITVDTPNGIWLLTIQCHKDHPDLTEYEKRIAAKVSEIFRLATIEAEKQSKRKLNGFLLLLGESCNDILVISTFGEILERHDGIGLYANNKKAVPGCFYQELVDKRFKQDIISVCECSVAENFKASFTHKIGGEEVTTNIMQIPASIRHYYSRAKAIVYTSKMTLNLDKTEAILSEEYGLTHAEVTASKFLADGYTIKDISDVMGLAESTMRQRFKTIYSKTGLGSQAQLVSMMFKVDNGTWRF